MKIQCAYNTHTKVISYSVSLKRKLKCHVDQLRHAHRTVAHDTEFRLPARPNGEVQRKGRSDRQQWSQTQTETQASVWADRTPITQFHWNKCLSSFRVTSSSKTFSTPFFPSLSSYCRSSLTTAVVGRRFFFLHFVPQKNFERNVQLSVSTHT